MIRKQSPIGVVLAGGLGSRIGGDKPFVQLRGRPLITYPLTALRAVLDEVVVIAKPDTQLPNLPAVEVWHEPPEPRHPLLGIASALELAGGRPVLGCPADMALLKPATVRRLVRASAVGVSAVAISGDGAIEPLLGCFAPAAAAPLAAAAQAGRPARAAVAALAPVLVKVQDPGELFNVNTPEDLLTAAALLASRR